MNAPPSEPVDALVARALDGDSAALNAVSSRVLLPTIEAVVARFLIGSRRWQFSVEDLTHDVLLHLLKDNRARLRKYDPARGALAAFVQVVARNWLIDFFEKKPPPEPTELADDSLPPDSGPERKVGLGQKLDRLAEALSEDDFLLFRMAYLENVERQEIAQRLQISLDAAHRRIQRLEARVLQLLSSQDA